jgi:hypothetical protein
MTAGVRTVAALLRHAWARHRIPLIPIALAVGVFQLLLTRLAPVPNEVNWMSNLLTMLPPEMRKLIGNEVALTPGGFLAIGYGHPFFILLLSAWVVRVSASAIAGEVGTGTMDLLATRPTARWTFIIAGIKTVMVGLAVIAGAAWIGTAVGLRLRPIGVAPSSLLPIVAVAWLVFTAFGALGLLNQRRAARRRFRDRLDDGRHRRIVRAGLRRTPLDARRLVTAAVVVPLLRSAGGHGHGRVAVGACRVGLDDPRGRAGRARRTGPQGSMTQWRRQFRPPRADRSRSRH